MPGSAFGCGWLRCLRPEALEDANASSPAGKRQPRGRSAGVSSHRESTPRRGFNAGDYEDLSVMTPQKAPQGIGHPLDDDRSVRYRSQPSTPPAAEDAPRSDQLISAHRWPAAVASSATPCTSTTSPAASMPTPSVDKHEALIDEPSLMEIEEFQCCEDATLVYTTGGLFLKGEDELEGASADVYGTAVALKPRSSHSASLYAPQAASFRKQNASMCSSRASASFITTSFINTAFTAEELVTLETTQSAHAGSAYTSNLTAIMPAVGRSALSPFRSVGFDHTAAPAQPTSPTIETATRSSSENLQEAQCKRASRVTFTCPESDDMASMESLGHIVTPFSDSGGASGACSTDGNACPDTSFSGSGRGRRALYAPSASKQWQSRSSFRTTSRSRIVPSAHHQSCDGAILVQVQEQGEAGAAAARTSRTSSLVQRQEGACAASNHAISPWLAAPTLTAGQTLRQRANLSLVENFTSASSIEHRHSGIPALSYSGKERQNTLFRLIYLSTGGKSLKQAKADMVARRVTAGGSTSAPSSRNVAPVVNSNAANLADW